MAKRSIGEEIKNDIKKETKYAAKRSVKKGIKNAAKEVSGGGKKHRSRNIILKILPYFTVVFALILAIFFVTVHIFDADAGFAGNAIQYLFGGLFGGAAILFPLVLGFFGVKWCIYNIKWKEDSMNEDSEDYESYKKAKGRIILQGIMAFLSVLMISGLFGVAAGYDVSDDFDVLSMWQEGGENLFTGGGGIFGSGLAALLVGAVRVPVSIIILVTLLIVFVLLTIGLTPDYIISKIQTAIHNGNEARKAKKEEEAKRLEEERLAEERAVKATPAKVVSEATVSEKYSNEKTSPRNDRGMSADDIENFSTPVVNENSETVIRPNGDIVDEMFSEPESKDKTSRVNGGDFGGEVGFDADEYDPLEELLQTMDKDTGEVFEEKLRPLNLDLPSNEPAPVPKELDLCEIGTDELLSDMAAVAPDEDGEEEEEPPTPYIFPPIELLGKNKTTLDTNFNEELQANARLLVSTLQSFKINIKEINYSRGPTITRYELKPEAGVRVRSIANLVDDISLSLATSGVRIEAPIPGKAAVGIEVPNKNRATVYLRDLIDNQQFSDAKSRLTASLGMDVGGNPIYFDISKMPHMLIAGATGMGKSVCINCIIISLLYKARPEDLKLILIDPKKVEFNIYKDIPHLYAPIVSEPKKAAGALASAVAEMERRFELIEEVGVRDIASYNAATENDPYKEHMPHMVIIIDELADLMMTAPDEVETAICRLAQKARAAGIHIIIGTQRPSVDVITGLIKANIPSRIACTVASQVDSRTIIDIAGAEKLIGRGDMLFAPVGAAKPMRVQGAFVTDGEVENIVTFIKDNNAKAKYNAEFINRIEEEAAKCGVKKGASSGGDVMPSGADDGGDSKFAAAVKLAVEEGKISTSLMQRRLGVGYGRAAKIIDSMEEKGYVSKPDGNKPRRVLLTAEEYARRVTEGTLGGDEE